MHGMYSRNLLQQTANCKMHFAYSEHQKPTPNLVQRMKKI